MAFKDEVMVLTSFQQNDDIMFTMFTLICVFIPVGGSCLMDGGIVHCVRRLDGLKGQVVSVEDWEGSCLLSVTSTVMLNSNRNLVCPTSCKGQATVNEQ